MPLEHEAEVEGAGGLESALCMSLVGDLAWVAGGFTRFQPVSSRGMLKPDAGFRATFATPQHIHVGDTFDLMLQPEVSDGGTEPVSIVIRTPRSIKPLLRTKLRYRPTRDATIHKFSFEALAPADEAEIGVVDRGRGAN